MAAHSKSQARTRKALPKVTAGSPETPGPAGQPAELLDMDGAIAVLKTTRPTFYRWVRSGRVKGMKIGRQWRFRREDLERFLQGEAPRIDLPASIGPLLEALRARARTSGIGRLRRAGLDPVEEAVWLMVLTAFMMRGSDIHLDVHSPEGKTGPEGLLRVRVDGVLHVVTTFDARLAPAIVEVWKRLAGCDVRQRKAPQDGRIQVRPGELAEVREDLAMRHLDLRVCFLPACLGESVTVRILDADSARLDLRKIPYAPQDRERILAALRAPWGLVLVTGPSGCGKTTLLYACLNQVAKPGVKAVSIEDPVEYLLPWTSQAMVMEASGAGFPRLVRSALRSDPDLILIGEIRDRETLTVAQQAALLGHLVLTTLHAEDCAGALRRMVDMGSDPFVVGDATRLVVSQRLVRKLCAQCGEPGTPAAERLEWAAAAAAKSGLDWARLPQGFRRPAGCPKCNRTGYRGRTVIAETLAVTAEIGQALRRGASADQLRALAVSQGMTPMVADGLRRAAAGETTLDEIARVLGAGV